MLGTFDEIADGHLTRLALFRWCALEESPHRTFGTIRKSFVLANDYGASDESFLEKYQFFLHSTLHNSYHCILYEEYLVSLRSITQS